jgi:hypothetical protein
MQEYARIIYDIDMDEDFIDVVVTIEKSLGIKFPDEAFAQISTLGELHDLVYQEAEKRNRGGNKCATGMSFYRLKAAIHRTGPPRRLSPSTPLRALSDLDYRAVSRRLGDWSVPHPSISVFGCLMVIALVAMINVPVFWTFGGWAFLTGLVSAIFLLAIAARLFPARLPGQKTVGELASSLAARNLYRLAEEGAALTPQTVWKALVQIVSDQMGIAPKRLSRESRFI